MDFLIGLIWKKTWRKIEAFLKGSEKATWQGRQSVGGP